jgi:hypothetical protein
MIEYNFTAFNLLIISGVLHGFIFSAIVLSRKKYKNNFFLALTVLFLSLSNLQYFIIDTDFAIIYPGLNYLFIPWQWLILPMFYLYVTKTIDKKSKNSLENILLFAPFFIVLFIQFFQVLYKFYIDDLYLMPSHFKRGIYIYIELFSSVFNITLILLTYRNIKFDEKRTIDFKVLRPETKWLKELIYIGLIICVLWLIALLLVIIFDLDKSYIFYSMWIGISVLVYWMGYIGLGKAQLLEERILLREQRKDEIAKIPKEKNSESQIEVFTFINTEMQIQKFFLNSELSIVSLAKELNLKPSVISESINRNTNYNFNDYIKSYLVNFARSLIYTTGLSPHSVATIQVAYQYLAQNNEVRDQLRHNINIFNQQKHLLGLKPLFVRSKSAIQCAVIPGTDKVKCIANQLQKEGFNVKAILSPTVPEGQERLRICLHSYNSEEDISALLKELSNLIFK